MKSKFTMLITCLLLIGFKANAQLASGSFAPNFTGVDLNGNEWTLYDILDQGKVVVLDISATWCSPCWDYHISGELETLYEQYGPDGTDELMVLMIEGDNGTNTACLYDEPDCV